MEEGKLVTIYGINGIAKTTQAKLAVKYLTSEGHKTSYLKYPIYDLAPEGPFINKYLRDPDFRKKNELSTHKLQKKYMQNRLRYEPKLIAVLKKGEWKVVEDYVGTGIAWGLTWGGDLKYLEDINKKLRQANLNILLHGNRFLTAIEKNHRNESNDEKMNICKNFHFLLAKKYGWHIVNANQTIEDVQKDIRRIIHRTIVLKFK